MIKYRILDLFAGAGGFSKGFDEVCGFKTLIACDLNSEALLTFKTNFPDVNIINGDLKCDAIKNEIVKISKETNINMIIGGPPCQGFSNKGKQLGLDDERNFLFLEYLNLVEKIKPEIFIIENVKTMLSSEKGYFIKEIINKINDLGYYSDYGILTASDYGVPQKRERAIIIACQKKKILLPKRNNYICTSVKDAIGDLAYLNSGEGNFESEYRNVPLSDYQKMMRANSKVLYNHVATKHSDLVVEKLKMIPSEKGKEYLPKELWGNQKFKSTWGRLVWDKVSPTIDTRFDTPSNGTNSHPELHRAITPREAARLQSFPDDFVFIGKKTHITRQIGNAVPPLMAKAIALSIKEQMFNGNQE